jgi:hypothetical protein
MILSSQVSRSYLLKSKITQVEHRQQNVGFCLCKPYFDVTCASKYRAVTRYENPGGLVVCAVVGII